MKHLTKRHLALALLGLTALLALPSRGRADYAPGTRVPSPTTAGQHLTAAQVSGVLQWANVLDYQSPDNVHFTFGGGTAGTSSVVNVNVVNMADGGVRVNLPSGATGYPVAVYSSTGVLLVSVSAKGVGQFSGGNTLAEQIGVGSTGANYNDVFGDNASATGVANVAMGTYANVTGNTGCAVGYGASSSGAGLAFGGNASATNFSLAYGGGCMAKGTFQIAEGYQDVVAATHNGSMVFGVNGSSTAANQLDIGSPTSGYNINDIYLGQGTPVVAAPLGVTLNASGGSGTNIAGANITIAGGKSTGTGAEGLVNIATSGSGATGTTLNSLTNRATISANGLNLLSGSYQVNGASYTGTIADGTTYTGGIATAYTPSNVSGTSDGVTTTNGIVTAVRTPAAGIARVADYSLSSTGGPNGNGTQAFAAGSGWTPYLVDTPSTATTSSSLAARYTPSTSRFIGEAIGKRYDMRMGFNVSITAGGAGYLEFGFDGSSAGDGSLIKTVTPLYIAGAALASMSYLFDTTSPLFIRTSTGTSSPGIALLVRFVGTGTATISANTLTIFDGSGVSNN